ncbi:hypothetical protein D9615_006795 [Tricholomella constricta]|uniref:Uncharacterized protein n=1 Tax=Tricholomella constricta TaxID=117010 RepID=A0A8H5H787_9AGAR|nr:hypothetical protein D9615_006795 [Tricholomella constricta]
MAATSLPPLVVTNLPTARIPPVASLSPSEKQRGSFYTDASDELANDSHTPNAILKAYERFKKRIEDFDIELGKFSKECRQLGRSYALIIAVRDLREKLNNMLLAFHGNATDLTHGLASKHLNDLMAAAASPSMISTWLRGVADAFEQFRERLNEFREHTEESAKVKSVVQRFERDLKVVPSQLLVTMRLTHQSIFFKYRASCLKAYDGSHHFNYINMRLFIHDLMDEMGGDLDEILTAFNFFNTYGVPAMQYEQKRDTESVHNMSTVATFFSAVTATTLQTSVAIQNNSTPSMLIALANTFWLCSLVLSIGAALNALMAAAWRRTTYGTRGRHIPLWVTIWIHASAPVFLVVSIACFSAGLVLFSYGSQQREFTPIVTLIATIVTSLGSVTVATWIAYDRWIAPLLTTLPFRELLQHLHPVVNETKRTLHFGPARPTLHRMRSSDSISDRSSISVVSSQASFAITDFFFGRRLTRADSLDEPLDPESQHHVEAQETDPTKFDDEQQRRAAEARRNWTGNARAVAIETWVSKEFWKKTPRGRPRTMSSSPGPELKPSAERNMSPEPSVPVPEGSVGPTYRAFRTSDAGVIQDLEYSPDGQLLATANYDESHTQSRTVCYVIENYTHTIFKHSPKEICRQIAWARDGTKLLARLDHQIDILDPQCKQLYPTINRPHRIESAAWCKSNGEELLSVERNVVFKLSLAGQIVAKYSFDNLLLRDVAVVPGSQLLLAIGRVMLPDEGMLPNNSRAEKQIILYDMRSKKYLSRNPLLNDVRHVTVAKKLSTLDEVTAFDVLLGHKNKPPQLWSLSPHLIGPHVLKPKIGGTQLPADLHGTGYFAGDQEQMILCVGQDGDVHIRDREQGHVQRVKAQVVTSNWRCIASSPLQVTGSMTFATVGAHGLKIWSAPFPVLLPRSRSQGALSISMSSLQRPVTIYEEVTTPREPSANEGLGPSISGGYLSTSA